MKKVLQIITLLVSIVYLLFKINEIVAIVENGEISKHNIISLSLFALFVFGALLCVKFQLYAGLIFVLWFFILRQYENGLSYEELSWGFSTHIFGIPILVLGILFVIDFWRRRSQW